VIPNETLNERYRVKSLERALDVIDALSKAGPEGMSVSEVARALEMSKSATFSILQTLLSRRFLADKGAGVSRRYRLGMAFARLGDQVVSETTLRDLAVPILRRLTAETGLTSRAAILDDGYAISVGKVDGPGTIRIAPFLGRRELAHATGVGKAILAALTPDEVRAIATTNGLPLRTPNTIREIDSLLVEVERIAERGYAVDDEEDTLGVLCIGASVWEYGGNCAGAISITGLKQEIRADSVAEFGAIVRRYADELSLDLGGPTYEQTRRPSDPSIL
jgi:IclR family acetate operon transcriptional repressor